MSENKENFQTIIDERINNVRYMARKKDGEKRVRGLQVWMAIIMSVSLIASLLTILVQFIFK